ncbi:MAG: glycogen/starch/alpha-glucan family phosphorylase [Oscillospiraceae bacterium]|jgi:starch phosphorylase|nr:glycogen/starch/alpha-glucan family phosphorylase [Oscillospiraceae bacterium]
MQPINREQFMKDMTAHLRAHGINDTAGASANEIHQAIAKTAVGIVSERWTDSVTGKQACYLSAEFLPGRLVFNNLLNLGILEDAREWLGEAGFSLDKLEEIGDPSLGNGGLGRLAACFLDSAATLGVPMVGYGIRYAYGLFRQSFKDGFQIESADGWDYTGDPWSVRREDLAQTIRFADMALRAIPYDMPIFGYKSATAGTLRLWQAEPLLEFDYIEFNNGKYDAAVRGKNRAEDVSRILYPNDNTKDGKKLRLRQEYFFSAASVRDVVRRFLLTDTDFSRLPDKFAIQLNDTHPVIAIPELIRVLADEVGIAFDDAFDIALRTFHYTNHTIMAEALEKWDAALMRSILPRIFAIIQTMEKRFKNERDGEMLSALAQDKFKLIADKQIHMARLAIYATSHTNGVSRVHTDILKFRELAHWNDAYPARFCNMTNGVTQRRWLGLANPRLTALVNELTGGDVLLNGDKLADMYEHQHNEDVLAAFTAIKNANKRSLASFILEKEGRAINPHGLFDIQIKRLHEYKRQLMNALHIIMLMHEIEDGVYPANMPPVTFIFGAKAAPGYARAKGIIKLINEIASVIDRSKPLSEKLAVVFVTNYNVSYAEKLVCAADLSEQISMAGTEASGTGNMKFMMNGTPTIGTYDGANIEIVEAAGAGYNYIFGATVKELDDILPTYNPRDVLDASPKIKRALDELISGRFSDGGSGVFRDLYDALTVGASWHKPDHYYVLGDLAAYDAARKLAFSEYGTPEFTRKAYMNMCAAGLFSSDNTIMGYATDIWGISSAREQPQESRR